MPWFPGAIRKEVTRHRTLMTDHRAVILHVAVSEADSLFGYFNQPGNPTSHFYVRKDGKVEQYVDTKYRAPAQLEGNPTCIGVESQGNGSEPWTPAQVESLAALCVWAHETHSVPLQAMRTSRTAERGIGYHRLGVNPYRVVDGELWSESYGKTCPGDKKIAQVPTIIQKAEESLALSDEDVKKVVEGVWSRLHPPSGQGILTALDQGKFNWQQAVTAALANSGTASAASVDDATIEKIAKRVADLIAARLTA